MLEKQRKQLGSTRALEIIRASIEKELGLPVRIDETTLFGDTKYEFIVFAEDATKKQVQYRRGEKIKFSLEVAADSYGYPLKYRNQDGDFVDMPENTDEIIKIMEETQ